MVNCNYRKGKTKTRSERTRKQAIRVKEIDTMKKTLNFSSAAVALAVGIITITSAIPVMAAEPSATLAQDDFACESVSEDAMILAADPMAPARPNLDSSATDIGDKYINMIRR